MGMLKDNPLRKRLLVLDNIARSSSANAASVSGNRVGALNSGKSTVLGHGAFVGYDADSAGVLSPNASIVSGNNLEDDSSLKNSIVTRGRADGGDDNGDLISMSPHPIISHEYIDTVNFGKLTMMDDGRMYANDANGKAKKKGAREGRPVKAGPDLLPLLIKKIAPKAYSCKKEANASSPTVLVVRKVESGSLTARSSSSDNLSFGKMCPTAQRATREAAQEEGEAAKGKKQFKRHPTRPPVTRHLYQVAAQYPDDRQIPKKVSLRPSTASLSMSTRPPSKSATRGRAPVETAATAAATLSKIVHVDIIVRPGSPSNLSLQDMSPSRQSIITAEISPPVVRAPPAANPVHPLSRFNDEIFDIDFVSSVRRVTKVLSRRAPNIVNEKTGTRFALHAPPAVAVAGIPINTQQRPSAATTATAGSATATTATAGSATKAPLEIDVENDPSSYFGGSLTAYVNQFLSPAAVAAARAELEIAERVAAAGGAESRPPSSRARRALTPVAAGSPPPPSDKEPLAREGADRKQLPRTPPSYAKEQKRPEAVLIKHKLVYHRHKLGFLKQLNHRLRAVDAASKPDVSTETAAGVVFSDGMLEDKRYFEGVNASLVAKPRRAPAAVPELEPEHEDDNSIFNHALSEKVSTQVQQYKTVKDWIGIGQRAEDAIANLSSQREKNIRDFYATYLPSHGDDGGGDSEGIVWFQRRAHSASRAYPRDDFASLDDSNRVGNADDIYDMFCGNLSTDSFMITEDANSAMTAGSPIAIGANRNYDSNNMKAALGSALGASEGALTSPVAVATSNADKAVPVDKSSKKPTAKERLYLHMSSQPVMDVASHSMPFSPRSSKAAAANSKKLVARTILSKKYLMNSTIEGDINARVPESDENELEIFQFIRHIVPKMPAKNIKARS